MDRDQKIIKLRKNLLKKEVELQLLRHEVSSMERSVSWRFGQYLEKIIGKINSKIIKNSYVTIILCNQKILSEGVVAIWRKKNERKKVLRLLKSIRMETQNNTVPLLSFPIYAAPLVSIIIPTYNNALFTFECLSSILRYTNYPYEIVVVENGSTDETTKLLKSIKNITVLSYDRPLGFAKACNLGAKKARGKFLLFLNNDTYVTDTWLQPLIETIQTQKGCGAVGPKLLNYDNTLQSAGGIFYNDGSCFGNGRGDNHTRIEYNLELEVDYCSGTCLLVTKHVFEEIGGFDIQFSPAYYEDVDLSLRIRQKGLSIFYQPQSMVYHHENSSTTSEQRNTYIQKNKALLLKKWQDTPYFIHSIL